MKVRLKAMWFAPTDKVQMDKLRTFMGRRYRPGVHEMPDFLFEHLPSSAEVLEEPVGEFKREFEKKIKQKDPEDAEAASIASRELDQIQQAHDEAEAERKRNIKLKSLAKARATRAANLAAQKAAQEQEAK